MSEKRSMLLGIICCGSQAIDGVSLSQISRVIMEGDVFMGIVTFLVKHLKK